MTAERVTNLYDLMDAAYDAAEIRAHSESLGHVPIIDVNPRNNSATFKQELKQEAKAKRTLGQPYAKDVRYRERSTVERVNGRLKDEFGARQVRVRGHSKVLCHLMFGDPHVRVVAWWRPRGPSASHGTGTVTLERRTSNCAGTQGHGRSLN